MGSSSALRFDPVNCVVTIVADEQAELSVFNVVGSESSIVCSREQRPERFPVIHGSVVYLGAFDSTEHQARAAVVFELPDGLWRASGRAHVRATGPRHIEARVEADTPEGDHVSMVMSCFCVDGRVTDRRRHSASST